MLLIFGANIARTAPAQAGLTSPLSQSKTVTASVDGVALTISAGKLPNAPVETSEAGLPLQELSLRSTQPYYSLAITAVPYGKSDTWDFPNLGPAKPGDAATWTAALRIARDQQGGASHAGPSATLFGKAITGVASTPSIPLDGIHYENVDMIEWAAEAGDRIYLVQFSQEHTHPIGGFGSNLTVSAAFQDAPTSIGRVTPASQQAAQADVTKSRTLAASPRTVQATSMSPAPLGSTLPAPSWWNGTTCDTAQNSRSFPLTSATVRGAQACGPIPETSGDSGTWGGISEWQCTELSERYMYLAGYISSQYPANGGQIVANYNGSGLQAESTGASPTSPALGDVVSMGTTHVEGHTALVLANHVDSTGNGYITILQQNFTSDGSGKMNVVNGVLQSEESGHSASWLHDPRNDAPPSVSAPAVSGTSGTVTVTGTSSRAATNFYVHLQQNGSDAFVSPAIPGGTSFSYRLDTTQVPSGIYQAVDSAVINGAVYKSLPTTVTISNAPATPQVSVTSPANGTIDVSGVTTLTASASDATSGASLSVQYFVDGAPVGSPSTAAPYSVSWNTAGVREGSHTITAKATATTPGGSASVTSAGVQAYVVNGGNAQTEVTIGSVTDVYSLGSDGNVYVNAYSAANGWSGKQMLAVAPGGGVRFVSAPSALVLSNGNQVDVHVTGSDGNIYEDYWTAAANGWSGWQNLGAPSGGFIGAPSTFVSGGLFFVYATGADGHVYEIYNSSAGWSSWQMLANQGAGTFFVSAPSVYVDSTSGQVDVHVTGADGNVYEDYFANNAWSGWASLGSPASGGVVGAPSTFVSGGLFFVYATGADGHVYEIYNSSAGWSSWQMLANQGAGTFFVSAPSVYVDSTSGQVDVHVTGADGNIYEDYFANNAWSGWASLGSPSPGLVQAPVTFANAGSFFVYALGRDGNVYEIYDSSAGWSSWQMLPNATGLASV